MRRVTLPVIVLAITVVALVAASSVLSAENRKTISIDFWLVRKGLVAVPGGWYASVQEFYDDPCLGSYMMSSHLSVGPSNPNGSNSIGGNVGVTAVHIQEADQVKNALTDIPRNWRNSLPHGKGESVPVSVSSASLARISGGIYNAKRYRHESGDWVTDLVVCQGQRTKYRKGMRYQGLDVTPIYVIEVDWPGRKEKGKDDVQSILKSLRLP